MMIPTMVMMDVMMMMMAVIIALTIWLPAQEPVATIIAQRKDAHELIRGLNNYQCYFGGSLLYLQ